MKISHGKHVFTALALLLSAGCASTPSAARNGRGNSSSPRTVTDTWATETPRTNVDVRQDAYANNVPAGNRKRYVTGSFVPQDVNVNGNSADTASPTSVYGQGDLRRRGGGGFSAGDSLSRVDPAISVGGR